MIVKAMLAFVRLPTVHRIAGEPSQNVYMGIDGYKALLAVPLSILFEQVVKGGWWFHMMRNPANDRCLELHNTLQPLAEVQRFDTHMRELYFHRFGKEWHDQQPPMCKRVTIGLKKEIVKVVQDSMREMQVIQHGTGWESQHGTTLAQVTPDECVILHT